MLNPLNMRITINCGKFFKRWEYQTTWPASWETCMQVKKQQVELDMEQWTVSKLGKEYIKAVYCHPPYLTYMQSTSCNLLGWMTHKLGLNHWDKYQQCQIYRQELKSLLMKVKEESEKAGLKLYIQKTKIMASSPITSWQIDGETMETVTDFIFWAPKSLQMVTAAMNLKATCSLEEKLWPT